MELKLKEVAVGVGGKE